MRALSQYEGTIITRNFVENAGLFMRGPRMAQMVAEPAPVGRSVKPRIAGHNKAIGLMEVFKSRAKIPAIGKLELHADVHLAAKVLM